MKKFDVLILLNYKKKELNELVEVEGLHSKNVLQKSREIDELQNLLLK